MDAVPHPRPSSSSDGLRALVDLASPDVAGPPERFLLPDGPRAAAVLAGVRSARQGRPAERIPAVLPVVVGACAFLVATSASGPALGAWAAVFVTMWSAAARALYLLLTTAGGGARAQVRSVALSREDSRRIARGAASAFADVLRAGGDADAAFGRYHEVLVRLTRFELAAGQAVAADRDLARLLPDDPLRPVAVQIAEGKAARAVAHRAAARAAADELQATLRSQREPEPPLRADHGPVARGARSRRAP